MKKMMSLLGLFIITAWLASCGSSNTDNGQANYACPPGTAYYNGACYNNNGGYVGGAGYTYNNGFYADNYSRTTSLQLGSGMREFFKLAMGVCDRAGGLNAGQASCQAYVSGSMDMIIQFPTNGMNKLLATFIAQPVQNQYINYSMQLPSGWGMLGLALGLTTGIYLPDPKQYSGAYRNPLQVELDVSLINKDAGFSANGYGDAWTGYNYTKLTIEVPQGKIQDYQMPFVFKVKDVPAASGVFRRCQRVNCGL